MREETIDAIREYMELIDVGYTEETALEIIKIAELKCIVDGLQVIGDYLACIDGDLIPEMPD